MTGRPKESALRMTFLAFRGHLWVCRDAVLLPPRNKCCYASQNVWRQTKKKNLDPPKIEIFFSLKESIILSSQEIHEFSMDITTHRIIHFFTEKRSLQLAVMFHPPYNLPVQEVAKCHAYVGGQGTASRLSDEVGFASMIASQQDWFQNCWDFCWLPGISLWIFVGSQEAFGFLMWVPEKYERSLGSWCYASHTYHLKKYVTFTYCWLYHCCCGHDHYFYCHVCSLLMFCTYPRPRIPNNMLM